jgi:hypothetical protein
MREVSRPHRLACPPNGSLRRWQGARAVVALVVLLLVATSARRAWAWPTGDQFDGDPVSDGGGGGLAFSGSPRSAGHDCAVCHTDPPRRVRMAIDADPVAIFAEGYQPGTTYKLRVRLVGEHAAVEALSAGDACQPPVDHRCDDNGYALEIADAVGAPRGTFAPLGADGSCGGAAPAVDAASEVLAAGDAVVHSGYHHGLDAWAFCWKAPAAGTGPLTIFAAAVDGNGGDGTAENPSDTVGDDVVSGRVPLLEQGGEPPATESGGCAIAPGASARVTSAPTPGLALVALASLVVLLALGCRVRAPLTVRLRSRRVARWLTQLQRSRRLPRVCRRAQWWHGVCCDGSTIVCSASVEAPACHAGGASCRHRHRHGRRAIH